jgi:imidazolonepropionase-like amidohydrolase
MLGLDDRVGSIEKGKDADLVVWSGDPLDVFSRAERVWIEGRSVYAYDEAHHRGQVAEAFES